MSKCLIVKYENLVESPFALTSQLLEAICGFKQNPLEIQASYITNAFRRSLPRPQSWRYKTDNWGQILLSTECQLVTKSQLDWLRRASTKATESRRSTSLDELCDFFGYSLDACNLNLITQEQLDNVSLTATNKLYIPNPEDLFDDPV